MQPQLMLNLTATPTKTLMCTACLQTFQVRLLNTAEKIGKLGSTSITACVTVRCALAHFHMMKRTHLVQRGHTCKRATTQQVGFDGSHGNQARVQQGFSVKQQQYMCSPISLTHLTAAS